MSLGRLSSGLKEGGRWGATAAKRNLSSYCLKKKKSGISGPYLESQHLGAVVRQIPQ